jgi:hypothetical protein
MDAARFLNHVWAGKILLLFEALHMESTALPRTWRINRQAIATPARRGGRDIKRKYRVASFDGADGVVVQDPQNFSEPEQPA